MSCKALGIPLPGELEVPKGGTDRVYRLEVGMRGVQVSERLVGTGHAGQARGLQGGPPLLSLQDHRPGPVRSGAATRPAPPGADDALLLTPGGFVAETAIWSVLWWEDDQLCGPAFDLGILPGVGRARLTELVGKVEERHSTLRELEGRPFILVNAVRGVVPVAIARRRAGAGIARDRRAGAAFLALTRPLSERYFPGLGTVAQAAVVVVAQLVRAPDCGSGGCGFNPRQPPW